MGSENKRKAAEIVHAWVGGNDVGLLKESEAECDLIDSIAQALTTARREQREVDAEIAKSMAKNWARMVRAPFSNSSHYSGLADGASQVAAAIREHAELKPGEAVEGAPKQNWRSNKAREAIGEAADGIANCYCSEDDTFFPEVERLIAAISEVVDRPDLAHSVPQEWQPIATATGINGRHVLVYIPYNKSIFTVYKHYGEWWKVAGAGGDFLPDHWHPSHWRPLPDAPKGDE